ncbi:MAG: PHP domain-containing protein [Candidatus Micrarchaeota archaeon]|nr:PHP domain-containing protein [Candidatus Micrarchaeota archaeon]
MDCTHNQRGDDELIMEFHIHTPYSDGLNPIWYLRRYGKDKILVITDHNTIRGALEYSKTNSTIISEEILCYRENGRKVEIIGMFLNQEIPKGLDLLEAIDRIKQQGGLVVAPHPLDESRYGLGEDADRYVDIVEVFNAKIDRPEFNDMAMERFKHMVKIVGSDAHYPLALGCTSIHIDEFDLDDPRDFLKKLERAKLDFRYYSWPSRVIWKGIRSLKRIYKTITNKIT